MRIENLKQGQIIKNYKELCNLLDIKPTGGDSKKGQLKELERYLSYHKEGNKFVIDEIFTDVKNKVDLRKEGLNRKSFIKSYKIDKSKDKHLGIYKIQKDNNIYIGSTCLGFRNRFLQHYNNEGGNCFKTYNLLHSNGSFEILFNATENNIQDDELIRMLEEITIKYYKLYTNYNIINGLEYEYK